MYKCKNCGNTEKFLGVVSEKGNAFIYKNKTSGEKKLDYSWIYILADNCWSSNVKIRMCASCNSKKIIRIQTIKN